MTSHAAQAVLNQLKDLEEMTNEKLSYAQVILLEKKEPLAAAKIAVARHTLTNRIQTVTAKAVHLKCLITNQPKPVTISKPSPNKRPALTLPPTTPSPKKVPLQLKASTPSKVTVESSTKEKTPPATDNLFDDALDDSTLSQISMDSSETDFPLTATQPEDDSADDDKTKLKSLLE
ncbi:uncharacterized protein LOC135489053 [Lineus longissimus]|uniref:uncharacterized protein LOC135489053 n=1 Tax=Lineus longissimus TaxID=88925 RepID=UPI00315D8A53